MRKYTIDKIVYLEKSFDKTVIGQWINNMIEIWSKRYYTHKNTWKLFLQEKNACQSTIISRSIYLRLCILFPRLCLHASSSHLLVVCIIFNSLLGKVCWQNGHWENILVRKQSVDKIIHNCPKIDIQSDLILTPSPSTVL